MPLILCECRERSHPALIYKEDAENPSASAKG